MSTGQVTRVLTLLFRLQSRFLEVMQEKVELKERVEELEHRCIQLSGETDTIGEPAGPRQWGCTVGLSGEPSL